MQTNYNRCWTIQAAQDLSAAQYKAVKLDGTIAGTPQLARGGLLQTKPSSGDFATVLRDGIGKAVAGAAINSGAALTVTTSGFLITHTPVASGSVLPVGTALVQAASGDIFECDVNFSIGGLTVVGSA